MSFLYTTSELLTSGYYTSMLDIFSLLAILSGILVIITKNPIVSILFLIGLFASISSYLIMIGLSFIGLSYLIVYIGAVSILFLFILMLINIRISELQSNTSNSIPLAIAIGISFTYPLFQILPYSTAILNNFFNFFNNILYNIYLNNDILANKILDLSKSNDTIYFVSSNAWDGNLIENTHITILGSIMYTNYNMWLILVSLILLLAMVGAIVITIKQKN